MPNTRRSRVSRVRDLEIHEALVMGLSPEQVGVRFDLPIEMIRAADRRALADRAALGPKEAARLSDLETLNALIRLAIGSYQKSIHEAEETTKTTRDESGKGSKDERTVRKKAPDPRYLRMAIWAVAELRKVRSEEEESPAAATSAAALPIPKYDITALRQAMLKHPDFMGFVRDFTKESTGISMPPVDFNDPMFDPRVPKEYKEFLDRSSEVS